MENKLYSEKIMSYATKCVDILNGFKDDLYDTIEEKSCCNEKKHECLLKINIFEEGSEILKDVFNLHNKTK
jgi:hypothetical protein